jgi:hypothetical protein
MFVKVIPLARDVPFIIRREDILMKTSIISIIALSLITCCQIAFADSVVVTETQDWTPVPITVDEGNKTYVVVDNTTVPKTNYYYSYQGNRCFVEKRDFVGINAIIFHAGISGGTDIYCYPE